MASGSQPETTRTADDGNFYEHPLYKMLHEAFPQYRTRQHILDVPALSAALDMSDEGVYKWLRGGRVSPKGIQKLVPISNGKLNKEKLLPFVI